MIDFTPNHRRTGSAPLQASPRDPHRRRARASRVWVLLAWIPALALARTLGSPSFPFTAALPDPYLTPGAINRAVTQANIRTTICRRHWTRRIRPPERYTERLKRRQIREYGYRDRRLRDYEEDHLIPLELGGSARSPRNLWPEPHRVEGGWGSYRKDRLENRLHRLVCERRLSLRTARRQIASNWVTAYRRRSRVARSAPKTRRR